MRNRIAKNRRTRNAAILTKDEKQEQAKKAAEILKEKLDRAAKALRQLELLSPVVHHYCPFRADACRMAGVPYGQVGVGTPAGNELPDHIRSAEMRLDRTDSSCFISPTRSAMERGAEREIRHAFHEAKRQERESAQAARTVQEAASVA